MDCFKDRVFIILASFNHFRWKCKIHRNIQERVDRSVHCDCRDLCVRNDRLRPAGIREVTVMGSGKKDGKIW